VQAALNEQAISTAEGQVARVKTYVDIHAPAIFDWRDKWKADLAVSRAFVLVCSRPAATKQLNATKSTPDWLNEEIRWWIAHQVTAPILVDAPCEREACAPNPSYGCSCTHSVSHSHQG
jgi:hypothetical protein